LNYFYSPVRDIASQIRILLFALYVSLNVCDVPWVSDSVSERSGCYGVVYRVKHEVFTVRVAHHLYAWTSFYSIEELVSHRMSAQEKKTAVFPRSCLPFFKLAKPYVSGLGLLVLWNAK
jgi:hypothetical protein